MRELTSDYDEWSTTDASTIGPSASACVRGLESTHLESDSWLMHVSSNFPKTARFSDVAGWILVDSGADEHVCSPNWATHVEAENDHWETILRDVQGNKLKDRGGKIVRLTLGIENTEGRQLAKVNFILGDISSPYLSLGRLLHLGCNIVRDSNELYLMKRSASVLPLIIRRNSLCVYARFVDHASLEDQNDYAEEGDSVIVAPLAYGGASGSNEPAAAVQEPAPAAVPDVVLPAAGVDLAFDVPAYLGSQPLHSQSRVEDPRARLRPFYVPIYGTFAS